MDGHIARIALIGDRDSTVTAHYAIERCFELAPDLEPVWIPTASIRDSAREILQPFNAVWCVPKSPYESETGALAAIRYARENAKPFLGTCGGFQHAILEYVRTVFGMDHASHAENTPGAFPQVISRMACPLLDTEALVKIVAGTRLHNIVRKDEIVETFQCSFGLNPEWESLFNGASFRISARDESGEVRAMELVHHRFFIATLFQPERKALNGGSLHPIVEAFFATARSVRVP